MSKKDRSKTSGGEKTEEQLLAEAIERARKEQEELDKKAEEEDPQWFITGLSSFRGMGQFALANFIAVNTEIKRSDEDLKKFCARLCFYVKSDEGRETAKALKIANRTHCTTDMNILHSFAEKFCEEVESAKKEIFKKTFCRLCETFPELLKEQTTAHKCPLDVFLCSHNTEAIATFIEKEENKKLLRELKIPGDVESNYVESNLLFRMMRIIKEFKYYNEQFRAPLADEWFKKSEKTVRFLAKNFPEFVTEKITLFETADSPEGVCTALSFAYSQGWKNLCDAMLAESKINPNSDDTLSEEAKKSFEAEKSSKRRRGKGRNTKEAGKMAAGAAGAADEEPDPYFPSGSDTSKEEIDNACERAFETILQEENLVQHPQGSQLKPTLTILRT